MGYMTPQEYDQVWQGIHDNIARGIAAKYSQITIAAIAEQIADKFRRYNYQVHGTIFFPGGFRIFYSDGINFPKSLEDWFYHEVKGLTELPSGLEETSCRS